MMRDEVNTDKRMMNDELAMVNEKVNSQLTTNNSPLTTIKAGYKNTEIGVIPEEWEVTNIAETSTLKARIGWQGLTTAEYLNTGNFHLVTGTDFKNGRIEWSTCHYVEKIRYTQDKNIQLKNEDILITKDGTIGKVAFVNNINLPATLNSGVFVVRSKRDSYKPIFAFYIFNSIYFSKFLNELVAGSTINHLYQKDFVNFNFPLPSTIEEQTAIATVLSDTDNLLQALQKKIAKKRLIKKGAMQVLLKPKEGWVVKTLGEVGEVKMCKRIFNYQTSEQGDIPFFKIGTFGKEPDAFISNEIYNEYRRKFSFPNKGDILISAAGTIGRTIVYNGSPSYYQDSNIVWLDNDEKLISNQFLWYIYQIVNYQTEGGTIQRLYSSIIYNTTFFCPNDNIEQERIATILSDMDAEIESLEKQLAKYKQIKQGLMQNLLTGKIRLV